MARMRGRGGRVLEGLGRLVLGPWWARPRLDAAGIRATRPRRIVVVRVHDQIGDMVCATPALAAIRRQFPAARLEVVCAPRHEPVLRHSPDHDGLLLFDRRRFNSAPAAAFRFRSALRALRADTAFVLNDASFSTSSALIAAGSGARWIVGGTGAVAGWTFTRWLYSLELPATDPALPAWRRGLLSLGAGGFELPDPLPGPVFVPGVEEGRRARAFLDGLGPRRAVGLHPGAGKPANRWPADRFVAVGRALADAGLQPWILEGPQDAAATAELRAAGADRWPLLRGVDLCEAVAALASSAAILVNDTGTMHLAAAAGARGVALFGPTAASSWAPPSVELRTVEAPDGRMGSIGVDEVLAALLERIGRER